MEQRLAQERRSFAKELHDTVSQSLTAIYLNTKFMERRLAEGGSVTAGELAELGETIHNMVVELHGVMSRLQAGESPAGGDHGISGGSEGG